MESRVGAPATVRLDRFVGQGPLPAGIAVELVRSVAAAMDRTGQRVRPDGLRKANIEVGAEVVITPAAEAGPNDPTQPGLALAMLLFELLSGRPPDPEEQLAYQVDRLRSRLPPGGEMAAALLDGLLASPDLAPAVVEQRCEAVLARLGGVSVPWIDLREPTNPGLFKRSTALDADDLGPDSDTGDYPLGIVAQALQESFVSDLSVDSDPLAVPGPEVGMVPPIVEGKVTEADVDKLLKALKREQDLAYVRRRTSTPAAPVRKSKPLLPVWFVPVVAVLIAVLAILVVALI